MVHINKSILISTTLTLALALGSASLVYAGYGDAGVAPVCGGEKPGKPWLYAVLASGKDQASLYVDKSDRANSWTVAYGVQSGRYIFGLTNFGKGNERISTVNHLPPGTYYFVIRGNNGCMPGPFSNEMSVRIGGGARLAGTGGTFTAPVRPFTTPANPRLNPVNPTRIPTPTVRPSRSTTPTPTPIQSFLQGVSKFFGGFFGGK